MTVSGEIVGSFRHGFFLVPEGRAETCPGWAAYGFTRHALIALTFSWGQAPRSHAIPPEFVQLDEMIRRRHLYPKVTATLAGHFDAKSLELAYRRGNGDWLGLIGGLPYPEGSVPASLKVESVSTWTLTLDDPNPYFPR